MKVYVTHPSPEGMKRKLKKEAHQRIFDSLLGDKTIEEVLLELLAKDWRPGQYRSGVGIPEEQIFAAQRAMQCSNTAIILGKPKQEVFASVLEFDSKKDKMVKAGREKLKDEAVEEKPKKP